MAAVQGHAGVAGADEGVCAQDPTGTKWVHSHIGACVVLGCWDACYPPHAPQTCTLDAPFLRVHSGAGACHHAMQRVRAPCTRTLLPMQGSIR